MLIIKLSKMINAAVPGTIFVKAINVKKNLNVFQIRVKNKFFWDFFLIIS